MVFFFLFFFFFTFCKTPAKKGLFHIHLVKMPCKIFFFFFKENVQLEMWKFVFFDSVFGPLFFFVANFFLKTEPPKKLGLACGAIRQK